MVTRARRKPQAPSGLSFNHAMVYSRDVGASLRFYRDLLGFKLLEEMEHDGRVVYARLRAPRGDGTLALHLKGPPGSRRSDDGIRLYFEVRELDRFCERLRVEGAKLSQFPEAMPWGWRHAYLKDPDGHEISLYWAGPKRFKKSKMRT
ncbi:MAG: VOC family protein [Thermoplasmata archaeon]|jgi:catechol 2,3-dioxygenase-like lactoylglutathione lyase family enzyme